MSNSDNSRKPTRNPALGSLKGPVLVTWAGLVAEQITRAFWPLAALLLLGFALLAFEIHHAINPYALWAGLGLFAVVVLWAFVHGVRRLRLPGRQQALDRIDAGLPGRPIAALNDDMAIGAGDPASEAVWRAHLRRMTERLKGVRAVRPDLRVSRQDPFGLRYLATIVAVLALFFGSVWRVSDVVDAARPSGAALAAGPAWEGWVEPPLYTGRPTLYLNEITGPGLRVPEGSRVTLRFYGDTTTLRYSETVSGQVVPDTPPAASSSFEIAQSGEIAISGPTGRDWQVIVEPDSAPTVAIVSRVEYGADGEMRQPFLAKDDYGTVAGTVTITLDLPSVDRRHGLTIVPDARDPIVVDLPMPLRGDRTVFEEVLVENFSEHPWAQLPVNLQFEVEDELGQTGRSSLIQNNLGGRRFFDTLAKAIVEQRRDLLWSRENARRVSQILRAVSYRPDDVFRDGSTYLQLKAAITQLENSASDGLTAAEQDEIAAILWDIALQIEDGDLSNALEELRRAQDRLAEAMRNGASDEEIAELMRELREAMQNYMRELAEQSQQNGQQQQQADNQNTMEITPDQLQQMLDRIQELMEEGRMAEAQQLLEQLRQMMENMQVTQGQNGQQGEGQQAMEGLAETLREQQGLSDDAFRDLQEQFNPNGQQGNQQDGGRAGNQGQGQDHNGQGNQPGDQAEGGQDGQPDARSLAQRQRALRESLRQQQQNLPGVGGEAGRAAREALDRAGRAMDNAEDALRNDDLAGALDDQSEAIDALREGMQNLGEALAQDQQQMQGQQGQQFGENDPGDERDPLGRDQGSRGTIGSEESLLGEADPYDRAQELMDEIRRRSGEQERPEIERDYLKRLLDRF